ncbi:MAG: hypothetical protein NZ651_02145 [Candidatus Bipolaricaulota bacterium]|nr:hypothetical protein [Candidatus Bipolaricaulota bacterium]MDW8126558.1 proton-conducting transporter membrane subunit [Candidatus Bipolaricaulota bacterium]
MIAALAGVLAYFALALLGIVSARGRETAVLAVFAGLASLALWLPGFPEGFVGGLPWGIAVAGDLWALAFWSLALFLHAAVILHAWSKDSLRHALITLLVATCLAGSISRDLFNLYVVLELSSLLSVILIAKEGRSAALWAALRYILLAGLGMIFYLFGLGLVYGRTGALAITALSQTEVWDKPLRIGAGLLLAGATVKTGVFLFGLWLPQAHGHAPTEVSVLLSGLVVKLGVLALARLAEAFPLEPVLLALGLLTGFGGVLYALGEKDLKIMLGHHTVSQIGYMLLGLGLSAELGALLYLVAHGLFKGLLFLCAGEAVEAGATRSIPELVGKVPWPAALGLAVGSWAIVGLPPLAGFVAKNYLSLAQPIWAKAFLFLLSVGTAASFAKLLTLFRGQGGGKFGGIMLLAMGVIALGLWGILHNPAVLALQAWVEAVLAVGLGFLTYLLVREKRLPLPQFFLEHALLSVLLATVALSTILLIA